MLRRLGSDMDNLKAWCRRNGGTRELAAKLGLSYQAVSRWFRQGYVPAERVTAVAQLTRVAKRDLNPAVFGAQS